MVRETRHLWVGNLPDNIREDRIREHFKRYGRVQSVKILARGSSKDNAAGSALSSGEIGTGSGGGSSTNNNGSSSGGGAAGTGTGGSSGTSSGGGLACTVAFMDIKSASKAHTAEHKLDDRTLTTEYYEPAAIPSAATATTTNQSLPSGYASSATNPRFPNSHGSNEDHPSFGERFYERGGNGGNGSSGGGRGPDSEYLRRPGYHEGPRGRARDRIYRGAAGPYSNLLDRRGWGYEPTTRYPSSSSISSAPDSNYSVDPVVSPIERRLDSSSLQSVKKKTKSRSGSESPSGSTSSRSPSRSRSTSPSTSTGTSSRGSSSPVCSPPSIPRGRALQSAVSAPAPPPVHSEDRRPLAICVRNLPARSSDTSLKDGLFHEYKKHGKVTWVKVVGQSSDRYALVCFKKPDDVEKALEVSYDKLFFGCKIEVAPYQGYDVEDNELRPYEAELDEYHPKATRTLFIGNLEKDVTASELRQYFEKFGEIIEIDIKKQGAVSSYAFCQFSDIASVVKAIRTMDGEHLGNNRIKLGFGKSMPTNCVWVDGVTDALSDKYLSVQFNQFGPVTQVVVDRERGHALIFFDQVACAQTAVKEMRGVALRGRKLQVDFAGRECQEAFYEHLEKQQSSVGTTDRANFDTIIRDLTSSTARGCFDSAVSSTTSNTNRFASNNRYESSTRPRTSSYSRSSATSSQCASAVPSPGSASRVRVTTNRYADYYESGSEYQSERRFRTYDEFSQGSADDLYEHDNYVIEAPTLQSVVVTTDPTSNSVSSSFAPPDIRHLQKERVHLLEQLEDCPSSGDEHISPKKRMKIDMQLLDSSLGLDHSEMNHKSDMRRLSDSGRMMSESSSRHSHLSRRPSTDNCRPVVNCYATPHVICKRRKTATGSMHHEISGGESIDGSRPGTPLCDERPENLTPCEPRRIRERNTHESPLSLPLPKFAAQFRLSGGFKSAVVASPPPVAAPLPPPPSPVHVPPPASPPPRPPSLSSNSSDSDVAPASPSLPSLDERIRSVVEKYEKWSGSRTLSATGTDALAKLDASISEKFRFRHKLLDIDLKEVPPSEIVKSVLARRSVFDEDSKRLENFGEKYEPREFTQFPKTIMGNLLTPLSSSSTTLPLTSVPATVATNTSFSSLLSSSSLSTSVVSPLSSLTQPTQQSQQTQQPTSTYTSPGATALKSLPGTSPKLPPAKGLQYPFPSHPPAPPTPSTPGTPGALPISPIGLPISSATTTCAVIPSDIRSARKAGVINSNSSNSTNTSNISSSNISSSNNGSANSGNSSVANIVNTSERPIRTVPNRTSQVCTTSTTVTNVVTSFSAPVVIVNKLNCNSNNSNPSTANTNHTSDVKNHIPLLSSASTTTVSSSSSASPVITNPETTITGSTTHNTCLTVPAVNHHHQPHQHHHHHPVSTEPLLNHRSSTKVADKNVSNIRKDEKPSNITNHLNSNSDKILTKSDCNRIVPPRKELIVSNANANFTRKDIKYKNKFDNSEVKRESERRDSIECDKKKDSVETVGDKLVLDDDRRRKESDHQPRLFEEPRRDRRQDDNEKDRIEPEKVRERFEKEKSDKEERQQEHRERERRREREEKERRELEEQERLESEKRKKQEEMRLESEKQAKLEQEQNEKAERERLQKEKQERKDKEEAYERKKEKNESKYRENHFDSKMHSEKHKDGVNGCNLSSNSSNSSSSSSSSSSSNSTSSNSVSGNNGNAPVTASYNQNNQHNAVQSDNKSNFSKSHEPKAKENHESKSYHDANVKERRDNNKDYDNVISKTNHEITRTNHDRRDDKHNYSKNHHDHETKSRHHSEKDEVRHKDTSSKKEKENRDVNHHEHRKHSDPRQIDSRHSSIDSDKVRSYSDHANATNAIGAASAMTNCSNTTSFSNSSNSNKDPNKDAKRKDRNGSSTANVVGLKRRFSSQDSTESTLEEAKRVKVSSEHKKLSDRRDSKESSRSTGDRPKYNSKHGKNSFSKMLDDKPRDDRSNKKDDKEPQKHKDKQTQQIQSSSHQQRLDKHKGKTKSKDREDPCVPKPNIPNKELSLDKEFLARLDLKANDEEDRHKQNKKDRKNSSVKQMSLDSEDRKSCSDDSKYEEKRKDKHERKSSRDESMNFKVEKQKKEEKRIRKMTNSSDTTDSDEPKKHSIFDIVDDEPAYISMYDKVKARSCKNMQKQEEEKRQEKIKAKFSQLKQSRAKREEKKRSTSWDEDSDSDERSPDNGDRQERISSKQMRRSNKLLITSSSEDEADTQIHNKRNKLPEYSDSDRLPIDSSDEASSKASAQTKSLSRKGSKSRISSDTSEDEHHKKSITKIKTECYSDSELDLGFVADSEEKQVGIKIEKHDSYSDSKYIKREKNMRISHDFTDEDEKLQDIKTEFKEENHLYNNRLAMLCDVSSEGEGNATMMQDNKNLIFSKSDSRRKHKKKQKRQKSFSIDEIKNEIMDINDKDERNITKIGTERKKHNKKEKKRDKEKNKDEFEQRSTKEKSKKSKKSSKFDFKSDNTSSSIKRDEKMQDIFGPFSDDSETGGTNTSAILSNTISASKESLTNITNEKYNKTYYDRYSNKLPQSTLIYGSDSDSISHIMESSRNIKSSPNEDREKSKEEIKKRKERKRKEKEKERRNTIVREENDNSVDLAEAGRALEAKLMDESFGEEKIDDADVAKLDEDTKLDSHNEADVFRFVECDESIDLEKKDVENKEVTVVKEKEKKKKRKKSKDEKHNSRKDHHHHHGHHHHHHYHYEKEKDDNSNGSCNSRLFDKKSESRKASIDSSANVGNSSADDEKPTLQLSPGLPSLADLSPPSISDSDKKSPPNLMTSPIIDTMMISPIPKTPTTSTSISTTKNSDSVTPTSVSPSKSPSASPSSLPVLTPTTSTSIVTTPTLPTTKNEKKKFIPGFGAEIDETIHETAIKSISEFEAPHETISVDNEIISGDEDKLEKNTETSDNKPRVIISQEETEDAVAALLGESFGSNSEPAFNSYNDDDVPSPSAHPDTIVGNTSDEVVTIPEDDEEMRQAVQSLNVGGDLEVKPDTPLSEHDLQIDTDTDDGDESITLRYEQPPKTPEILVDYSQTPKTPDIPSTYYNNLQTKVIDVQNDNNDDGKVTPLPPSTISNFMPDKCEKPVISLSVNNLVKTEVPQIVPEKMQQPSVISNSWLLLEDKVKPIESALGSTNTESLIQSKTVPASAVGSNIVLHQTFDDKLPSLSVTTTVSSSTPTTSISTNSGVNVISSKNITVTASSSVPQMTVVSTMAITSTTFSSSLPSSRLLVTPSLKISVPSENYNVKQPISLFSPKTTENPPKSVHNIDYSPAEFTSATSSAKLPPSTVTIPTTLSSKLSIETTKLVTTSSILSPYSTVTSSTSTPLSTILTLPSAATTVTAANRIPVTPMLAPISKPLQQNVCVPLTKPNSVNIPLLFPPQKLIFSTSSTIIPTTSYSNTVSRFSNYQSEMINSMPPIVLDQYPSEQLKSADKFNNAKNYPFESIDAKTMATTVSTNTTTSAITVSHMTTKSISDTQDLCTKPQVITPTTISAATLVITNATKPSHFAEMNPKEGLSSNVDVKPKIEINESETVTTSPSSSSFVDHKPSELKHMPLKEELSSKDFESKQSLSIVENPALDMNTKSIVPEIENVKTEKIASLYETEESKENVKPNDSVNDHSDQELTNTIKLKNIIENDISVIRSNETDISRFDDDKTEDTESGISDMSKENMRLSADILENKDDPLDSKEDSDYWSAKEVNIESVIKTVDALCSADELSEGSEVGKEDWYDNENKLTESNQLLSTSDYLNKDVDENHQTKFDSELNHDIDNEADQFDEGIETCHEERDIGGRGGKRGGRLRGRKSQSKLDRITAGVQTRRGGKKETPTIVTRRGSISGTRGGIGTRGKTERRIKRDETQESSDVYEFHDDSDESKNHPRLIMTIKSSTGATSNTTPTVVVKETPAIVSPGKTKPQEFVSPAANTRKSARLQERDGFRNTVDDTIEDVIRSTRSTGGPPGIVNAASVPVSQQNTSGGEVVDETRHSSNVTRSGVTGQPVNTTVVTRRLTRQNVGKSPSPSTVITSNVSTATTSTIELRKPGRAGRKGKDRRTSETTDDSSEEKNVIVTQTSKPPPSVAVTTNVTVSSSPNIVITSSVSTVVSSDPITTNLAISKKEENSETQHPTKGAVKVVAPVKVLEEEKKTEALALGRKASMMRRIKGDPNIHDEPQSQTLIDPVTGLLMVMKESEGNYITISTIAPTSTTTSIVETTRSLSETVYTTLVSSVSSAASANVTNTHPVITAPVKEKIISQPSQLSPVTIAATVTTTPTSKPHSLKAHVLSSQAAINQMQSYQKVIQPQQPQHIPAQTSLLHSPLVQQQPQQLQRPSSQQAHPQNLSSPIIQHHSHKQISNAPIFNVHGINQNLNVNVSLANPTSINLSPRQSIVSMKIPPMSPVVTSQQQLHHAHHHQQPQQQIGIQNPKQHLLQAVVSKPNISSPLITSPINTKAFLLSAVTQSMNISTATAPMHLVKPAHVSMPSQLSAINQNKQVLMGQNPALPLSNKLPHSLHVQQQQIMTGAVASPPLKQHLIGQQPIITGASSSRLIVQGSAKGVMDPPKVVDTSLPAGCGSVLVTPLPSSPQLRGQLIQPDVPMPGYEAGNLHGLSERSTAFSRSRQPSPPPAHQQMSPAPQGENLSHLGPPNHYVPPHLYQQYMRVQPQQRSYQLPRSPLLGGVIEKPCDSQEGEEAPVTSPPPLELRRPSSGGTTYGTTVRPGSAAGLRPTVVPHGLQSPHAIQSPLDRTTDSPQVYMHGARILHYGSAPGPGGAARYYENPGEPPPAHRAHSVGPPPPTIAHSGSTSYLHQAPPHIPSPMMGLAPPHSVSNPLMPGTARHGTNNNNNSNTEIENATHRGLLVGTPPHSVATPGPVDSLSLRLKFLYYQEYPIMWQGLLALKNDTAAVQMYYVFGNRKVAEDSLPFNSDGSTPPLRIAQRMRLDKVQIDGVARKLGEEKEHCMLLAVPCGPNPDDVVQQSSNLNKGFINYLQEKQAAGIVNIAAPGTSQAAFVIHMFPSCDFANEYLRRTAPQLFNRVAGFAHLIIIIATV